MAKKNEDIGGVWRTIGGRRVFIKDGQDLASAMKESGKFKKSQIKNAEIDKKNNPYATNNQGGIDDNSSKFADEAIKHWEEENAKYKEKYGKDDELAIKFKEQWEKEKKNRLYGEEKTNNEGVRTLSGDYERDNKGRIVSQKEYDEFRQAYKDGKISKEDYRNDNYDALKSKKEMTAQEASENQLKRMYGEYKDVSDLRDEYEDKVLSKYENEYIKKVSNAKNDEELAKADKYFKEKTGRNWDDGRGNDYLPKEAKIKEQGKSNRAEVSNNIQAHILSYYDNPVDFMEQMDAMDYLPTKWRAGEELAKGGSYLIYNGDMADFLNKLKINPKGKTFSDDKSFNMYASLIGRESEHLYNRLEKLYSQYKAEHKNSDVSLDDFRKWFK